MTKTTSPALLHAATAALLASPLFWLATASAAPAERRLHVGQAEASSYDKNDWNRFEENYLPLYVADDDPTTAWTEGAEGDGAGQWLRLHVSPMKGATRVRLKIRNGYQKTPKLFAANARAKKVAFKLLPGGAVVERELTDTQGWQEVELTQPAGDLSGVELKIVSTYAGKKYADLCISDLQLFVTAETADNPAYEKSVYERVKKWKADRVAAAAAFKKAAAGRPLPVASAYQSQRQEAGDQDRNCSDFTCYAKHMLKQVHGPSLTAPEHEAIEFLQKELAGKLADWQAVQVVADGAKVPSIDGTCAPGFGSCEFDMCDDPQLPIDHLPLLERSGFKILEMKQAHGWSELVGEGFDKVKECRRDEPASFAFARREGPDKKLRALLMVRCGLTEGREGKYPTHSEQLLVYGDDGRARLVASAVGATTYRWEGAGAATATVAATVRVAGGRFASPISVGTWEAAVQVAKAPSAPAGPK